MKNILYSLFTFIMFQSFTFAQTLISDEDYITMMSDYAVNLNSVLDANCPQGMTIDQFKKKIVNGELTLSSTAQASILTYAEPLKTYGSNFATSKNLTVITDAEKIFLSSFPPSIVIQDNKLIPNGILLGLTPYEMWECALNSFYTEQCGINAIVSDKSDIKGLTKACTTLLTQHAGNLGILVVINGFSECLGNHNNQIDVFNNISYSRLMSNSVLKQKLLEYGTNIQNNNTNELFVPAFGFSILTDSITYMGREATHSYTFRIKRQNQSREQLDESLVLTKNNNKYQANLIQYRLSLEDEIAIYDNSLESIDVDLASKITVFSLPGEDKPCWEVTGTSGICNFPGRHTIYDVINGADCAGPPTVHIIWKQVPCANPPPITEEPGWITMDGSISNGGSNTGGGPASGWGSSGGGVGVPSSAIPAGSNCLCCTQLGNPCIAIKPMSQFITPKISTKPVFLGAAYNTFKNNLNNEQRDWWETAPVEIKSQIQNYLLFNRTADVDFALRAVTFLRDNSDVTFNFLLNNRTSFDSETGDLDNNTIGNYDNATYADFNPQQNPWISIPSVIPTTQFVGWNRSLHPTWQCMEYAKAQIEKKGYKISDYFVSGQTFQVYREQTGVNQTELAKGLSYLKYALSNGIPVIVGVDDAPGSPNKRTDNTTDHFIVIVGMGSNSLGNFFQFYDNASGDVTQGANQLNLLYYSPTGIISGRTQCSGYRDQSTTHNYILTQIRKSKK